MTKYLLFFLFYLLMTSCNQNSSQTERDYIKNLEEKNRALEKELQEEKNKPPVYIEKKSETVYTPQETKKETETPKDYFTIGSTEDEVLEVMGDPTEIKNWDFQNEKWLYYGFSKVVLRNGKVKEYSNIGKNLKIKVKK